MYANLYYPFPFQKRLKITASVEGGMQPFPASWYQYTYVKFPSGTVVKTWPGPQVDSPAVRQIWENMGQDPKPAADAKVIVQSAQVPRGGQAVLLDLPGSGSLASLRLTMDPWNKNVFDKAVLRVTWDDQKKPAIEMPIGCLFGGGGDTIGGPDVSGKTYETLLFGFDAKTRQFHSYWPMPFWSRAKIEVLNRSSADIRQIKLEAAYVPASERAYPRNRCGYFCAKRTIDISPDNALWSHAFAARGDGKVTGIMMYSKGYAMDGDEFTYIDGSKTPQMHGDGTEDDHNQGWGGYAVQQPYWGGVINGFQGGCRLYVNDSYHFNREIVINYEHSLCGGGRKGQKTDCIVWYYLRDPAGCNLRLTDELDVGDAHSEKAHQYAVSRETWSGRTAAAYDACEQGPPYPLTDHGRAFTGKSRFTIALDPHNQGVKLRRRLNRNLANVQLAKVYVDGVEIADTPWYFCDLPAPRETAFADTDFEIPARYTQGKSRITITVEHVRAGHGTPATQLLAAAQAAALTEAHKAVPAEVAAQAAAARSAADPGADASNEYYYWVYCYGPTPL